MTDTKKLGNLGESIAKSYLEKEGYFLLEKNYRVQRFEIDLICSHKKKIIFIEVKTRIRTKESKQEESLSLRQTKNLQKAIIDYCFKKYINLSNIRLDLINILIDKKTHCANLRHYKDII